MTALHAGGPRHARTRARTPSPTCFAPPSEHLRVRARHTAPRVSPRVVCNARECACVHVCARARVQEKTTVLAVSMSCEGCANTVKRLLGKVPGVSSVHTDVATQRVEVVSSAEPPVLMEALSKWATAGGKTVELVSAA
ncbi:heavy-metal-associated domain-containing protein [archaeon]|nr:MAG: heavy-metal-associated domain-containing protein [archaeon]